MHQKNSHKKTTPLPNNENDDKFNLDKEILTFAPIFININLTISSIGAAYRAYASNDMATVAFILFVLAEYFALEMCFRALNRLPRDAESPKKSLLKFIAWLLSTALMFAFVRQFGAFASLAMTVTLYGVAIAGSACIFFVSFICDDKKNGANGVSSTNGGEKLDDTVTAAVFEKV